MDGVTGSVVCWSSSAAAAMGSEETGDGLARSLVGGVRLLVEGEAILC